MSFLRSHPLLKPAVFMLTIWAVIALNSLMKHSFWYSSKCLSFQGTFNRLDFTGG